MTQKFSTLEALVAHVKEKVRKDSTKPQRPPVLTNEQKLANAIAAKIEAELQWQPTALVLLSLHQHCSCGSDYRSVIGLFLDSRHKSNGGRRLRPPADLRNIDALPHKREEISESIAICPHCILEREVAGELLQPAHECCVQLPLFDHQLQQRVPS